MASDRDLDFDPDPDPDFDSDPDFDFDFDFDGEFGGDGNIIQKTARARNILALIHVTG